MLNSRSQLIEVIRSYRWNSLFVKYFKKIYLVVLFPFVFIALLLILYICNNFHHEQDRIYNEYQQKNLYTINSAFENISKQQIMFTANRYISAYFTADNLFLSSVDFKIDMIHLSELLQNTIISLDYITNIQLLSFENDYVMTSNGGFPLSDIPTPVFFSYYKQNKPNFFILSDNPYFWVVYEYKAYGNPLGLIAFKIDFSKMSNQLLYNNSKLYLLSEDNTVLFSSDNTAISKEFIKNSSNNQNTVESALEYYKLKMITTFLPDYQSVRSVIFIIIFCFIIILLVPLVFSLYLSYQTYTSITKIIASLGGYTDDQTTKNELAYIELSIKNIVLKQHDLEAELASRLFQLKKVQTLALQTQFNPHFLFNTINLAIAKEVSATRSDTDVSKILGLLSTLLRASLNTKNYIISVAEELNYAKTYVKILSIRYNDNFDVVYNIDDNTLELKTLKLVLQPLLENAFEHGIHQLNDDIRGKIIISSQLDHSNLVLTVYNNGVPCEAELLKKLQKMLEDEYISDNLQIGLANVNTRIKLTFGPQYGCQIDSNDNGTTCTILLPAN